MSHIIFCSYRYDACILMFVWMFVPVPQYNFIIHNICMKTLNVYFHAVHFLNKPTMFLIKKKTKFKNWICSYCTKLHTPQMLSFSRNKIKFIFVISSNGILRFFYPTVLVFMLRRRVSALCRSTFRLQATTLTAWSQIFFFLKRMFSLFFLKRHSGYSLSSEALTADPWHIYSCKKEVVFSTGVGSWVVMSEILKAAGAPSFHDFRLRGFSSLL